jgi:small-conductance mechanosensitive channel
LTFAFVALRVVHIPLTVFTLLGGALAIGVGFGSQAIISNFISGLIILIEQPVRVGDLIEVDQLKGSVMHIGMRSTTVRTGRNTDIIVPNSFFLEKNVVNWTLNDDRVRTQVTVGVMYGSPLTRVKELLLQAANEHAYTIKEPTPVVLLTSLGDTTVGFELQVWVSLKSPVERAQIESDLRFRIYELFSANSITIHCPRRDIALHTAEPLAVTLEKA